MNIELIKWIDARSIDGWAEVGDIDAAAATITTVGIVMLETANVLCMGGSESEHRREASVQYAGIMVIPKQCIVERHTIEVHRIAKGRAGLREKLTSLLAAEFPSPAKIELQDGDKIIAIVISEQFEGMDHMSRNDMVRNILNKGLELEERCEILLIISITPVEYIGHSTCGANYGAEREDNS